MQDNFLLVFVDGGDAGASRGDNISASGFVADLEDALPCRKLPQVHLRSKDAELVIVEVGKQRYIAQHCRITGHRKSPELKCQQSKAKEPGLRLRKMSEIATFT